MLGERNGMARRVTLADVAERAGVSKTAVSLVLNERPGSRLSAQLADRVRAAAAELDYRPNPAARTLRRGTSQVIGFISDEVTITRYASAMIRGALDVAQQHEHTVLIAETGTNRDRRERALRAVLDQRPDGLVFALMGAKQIDLPTLPDALPVVILNGASADAHPSVLPDERVAGSEVARTLVDAGHRQIGIVGLPRADELDPRVSVTVADRVAGIATVLEVAGVDAPAEWTGLVWEPERGYQATHRLLGDHPELTGLICLNDRLAFGAYQAIQELGRRIPEDVSVVSFDDDEIAAYLRPPLTTARLPYEQMGRLAMGMLLDPGPAGPRQLTVPMPVQHRASVAVPRAGDRTP